MRTIISRLDAYVATCVIIVSSLWCALALFHPPSNFDAFPSAFRGLSSISKNEQAWGIFIGSCAVLHFFGVLIYTRGLDRMSARILSGIGLFGEGSFLMIAGISTAYYNPDTLFGVPVTAIGIAAAVKIGLIGMRDFRG